MIYWLLDNALAALPLALLALLAGRLLPKRPGIVHLFWVAVLLRLVLPPLQFPLEAHTTPSNPAVFTTEAPTLLDSAMRWMTRTFGGNWSFWLVGGLVGAWITGALLFLGRELVRLVALRRVTQASVEPSSETLALTEQIADRLGVDHPDVRVVQSLPGPFVLALRGTKLVLPDRQRERALPAVLAHELAHLARRDHWTAWIEVLALALHWWNPVFWLARHQLHTHAELACDAWVLRLLPEARLDYAESLVEVAARASGHADRRPVKALGLDAADLERRLRAVLDGDPAQPLETRHPMSFIGIGLVLLFLPPWFLPPSHELVPDYPAGVSAGAVLEGMGAATWDELLARANQQLASGEAQLTSDARNKALHEKGLALMALSRFDEAIAVFEEQIAEGLRPSRAAYNIACAQARAARIDQAVEALWRARELGFDQPGYLLEDPDLTPLHDHPRFVELLDAFPPALDTDAGDA